MPSESELPGLAKARPMTRLIWNRGAHSLTYTPHRSPHVLPPFPTVKGIFETYIYVIVLVCCLCPADCTGFGRADTLRRVRGVCLACGCHRDLLFPATFLRFASSILCGCCRLEARIPPTLTSSFHAACGQALCYFRQSRQGK